MTISDLAMAVPIGFAFGWSLECAGLGDARKLSGQFYLRDFTVIKVMLTAIVVAMLGTFWLARFGVIDLGALYLPETFLVPQIAGGLIFGAGFALSGLCPGTACVAAASGRFDGMAAIAGLFAGMLLTGLSLPSIKGFYGSTALGVLTLPELAGLSYGLVVAVVTVLAIAVFLVIEHCERRP